MIKIKLQTYLRNDGTRAPYKLIHSDDAKAMGDDRIEDGVFLTVDEFEKYCAARDTVDALRLLEVENGSVQAIERRAFEAALSRKWMNACGDELEPSEWENAYELWIEGRKWGMG